MKKKYIIPCAKINDYLSPSSIICTSGDITTNPESLNGGTTWTGGSNGMSKGEGNGTDANDSKQRGFYSAYGSDW